MQNVLRGISFEVNHHKTMIILMQTGKSGDVTQKYNWYYLDWMKEIQ